MKKEVKHMQMSMPESPWKVCIQILNFFLKKEKIMAVLSRILGNTTGKKLLFINSYDFCSLKTVPC